MDVIVPIPRAFGGTIFITITTLPSTLPQLIVEARFRSGEVQANYRDGKTRVVHRDGIVTAGGR